MVLLERVHQAEQAHCFALQRLCRADLARLPENGGLRQKGIALAPVRHVGFELVLDGEAGPAIARCHAAA